MPSDKYPLSAMLNELLPEERDKGDWSRVLADAARQRPRITGPFTRRRAYALAAVTVTVAAAPIAALAISGGWVFGNSLAPAAAGDVVPIRTGETAGLPWTLAGYRSASGAFCIAFVPTSQNAVPTRTPLPADSSTSCAGDTAAAANTVAGTANALQFFGSTREASGHTFAFVAGRASADVARVTVLLRPSGEVTVDTVAAPAALAAAGRFFAAVIPNGSIDEIVALDSGGAVIETIRITQARPPTSTTSNSGTDFAGP